MQADSTPTDGIASTDNRIAYRVRDAADVVGLSERQMWDLVQKGGVESFKIGTSRRITREALVSFIKQHQNAA